MTSKILWVLLVSLTACHAATKSSDESEVEAVQGEPHKFVFEMHSNKFKNSVRRLEITSGKDDAYFYRSEYDVGGAGRPNYKLWTPEAKRTPGRPKSFMGFESINSTLENGRYEIFFTVDKNNPTKSVAVAYEYVDKTGVLVESWKQAGDPQVDPTESAAEWWKRVR